MYGWVSPVYLHGAQHELLTERSCFVRLWKTKLGCHLRLLPTLTCFSHICRLFSGGAVKSFRKNISDLSSQIYIYIYIFFPYQVPFIIVALLFSLTPSHNSDPGSHSGLFSLPPHYGSCLAFLSREDFSSSLVDSRRIVLTHARRSQQLIPFFNLFLQTNSKSRHGGIRTHGPTLVAFEGYH